MIPNTYPVTNSIRISAEFRDANNVLTDPAAVVCKYRNPSTLVVTTKTYGSDVEVVKESTGKYYLLVSASVVGDWHYRFTGDSAAKEGFFRVEPSVLV